MWGSCKAFWSSIVTLHLCSRSTKTLAVTTTIRSSCCSLQVVWKWHLTLWWWQLFTWIVGSKKNPGHRADQARKNTITTRNIIDTLGTSLYPLRRQIATGLRWQPIGLLLWSCNANPGRQSLLKLDQDILKWHTFEIFWIVSVCFQSTEHCRVPSWQVVVSFLCRTPDGPVEHSSQCALPRDRDAFLCFLYFQGVSMSI